jgi:hypothetical protein
MKSFLADRSQLPRFAINNGESYWIHFFVGPVGEPKDYMTNPNRVGSVYNFSASYTETGCENCKGQIKAGVFATGQVPITGAILKDWLDEDIADLPASGPFNQAAVEEYLHKHLEWRIVSVSGCFDVEDDHELIRYPGRRTAGLS